MAGAFASEAKAQDLNPTKVPTLEKRSHEVVRRRGFSVGITLAGIAFLILIIAGAIHVLQRIKYADEMLEEWEIQCGAHRFKYAELASVTKGFGEQNLVGSGGFGRVYRGLIPSLGLEVAIK